MPLTAEMVAETKKIQDIVRPGLPWGAEWIWVFVSWLGYPEFKVKLENFLCETDEKGQVHFFNHEIISPHEAVNPWNF